MNNSGGKVRKLSDPQNPSERVVRNNRMSSSQGDNDDDEPQEDTDMITNDTVASMPLSDQEEGLIGDPLSDRTADDEEDDAGSLGKKMLVFTRHGKSAMVNSFASTEKLDHPFVAVRDSVYLLRTAIGSGSAVVIKADSGSFVLATARHVVCNKVDGEWKDTGVNGKIFEKQVGEALHSFGAADIRFPTDGSDLALICLAEANDMKAAAIGPVDITESASVSVLGLPGKPAFYGKAPYTDNESLASKKFRETYGRAGVDAFDEQNRFAPANTIGPLMTMPEFEEFWKKLFGNFLDVVCARGKTISTDGNLLISKRVSHTANTTSGMSGGPVCIINGENVVVVGVHAGLWKTTTNMWRNYFVPFYGTDACKQLIEGI